ncbi:hypothetical protein [Streptacidiphilus sp. EB103A]|uniref:hypothetical protein n=1 Tax=Streptacidiphilus sp. EB103A TaxID=3156275 RepID=UPI0035168CBE
MNGAVRLLRRKAADVRGAESFVGEALAIAQEAGGMGIRLVRADSKFYTADMVAACRRAGTRCCALMYPQGYIAARAPGRVPACQADLPSSFANRAATASAVPRA